MKNSSLLISALCFACITAVGKGLPVIKNEKQERIVSPMEMYDDEAATNKQFNGQMFANWGNVNRSDRKTDTLPAQQKASDFNTTRSNRQNSNYQAGRATNNGNPNAKDSIPKKMEAQDFNTTRSNRQNSNYQAGRGTNNGNPNAKDSIPKKVEAQDFNTTRSNRQNSNYQAGRATNNGNPNSKDSIPKKMEAQDFNTTRSNRQNSNYQAGIATNNGNLNSKDSIPKKMEAQDFNTTRSNRQNSNYQAGRATNNGNPNSKDSIPKKMEAQDFNTTRSNRQNSNYQAGRATNNGNPNSKDSIPKKMEAQDFNTTRSNRQNSNSTINTGGDKKAVQGSDGSYNPWEMDDNNEGTVMNPLVGGNSTGGNNPLSSSVSIFAGVATGGNDYTGSGWNGGLEYQLPMGRMLSLTAGVGFSSLEFRYRFSEFLPEKMVGEMEETIADNSWGITTLSAGPRLQIGRKKLRADIYGKAGISFVRNPKQFIGLRDEEGKVTEATGLARFSGNQTAFSILTGAAVKYALGRKVDIFINPYIHFYPAQNISFTQKDAGKALENGKDFNFELFSKLPFEKTRANLQSMGLNLGFTYYLFK